MTTQHTPGRLTVTRKYTLCTEDGETPVASTFLIDSVSQNDEANARRLVACWNRLEKFTTEQIEDLGYDLFADVRPDFERAMRERDELLNALKDAATSLETISILSGRKTFGQPPIETYMEDFMQVRGYANSRMTAARAAIAKVESK